MHTYRLHARLNYTVLFVDSLEGNRMSLHLGLHWFEAVVVGIKGHVSVGDVGQHSRDFL